MFKNIIFCSALLLLLTVTEAQPIKTPAPSPTQTIKQDFGLSTVELSYSRPNIRGRKVFGDLVPYGNVWRTGANQATVLTFSDEVLIGTAKVPAGKYGLLSIPGNDSWTLILTKQTDVTSPAAYKQENDVVRVAVKPMKMETPMETLTMQFANVQPSSTELHIMWDNTAVSLPIKTDVETKVMVQINNAMTNDNRPYFQAAMYYLENGKDVNQAITWLDKALAQNPKAYWMHHQRANALAKAGKKVEAKVAANKSIELAKDAKNDDYVRLNEKLLATLK